MLTPLHRLLGCLAVLALASCSPAADTEPATSPAPDAAVESSAVETGQAAPADAAPLSAHETWAHETSDVPVDPAVRYGALDNGLRYAILANDTPSGTAALRLRFDAGALMEEDDQRGLAHVLEHMAFNGSENVPEGEMIKILERAGLAFGPDTNAYTSFDETVYELDVPDVSAEEFDTAFFLLRETADKLTIAQDALDRERGVVLSEYRAGDTYQRQFQEASWAFLYPGARFVDRLPIGTPEVITTAPASRVRDLYETYYRPDRAIFVAVGDFDVDAMETRIRETFADWAPARDDGPDGDPGTVEPRGLAAGIFVHPEQPTSIGLYVIRPGEEKPDTLATRRENFVRTLGFGMLNRRYQRLARDVDAAFVNAGASYGIYFDAVEQVSVGAVSKPDDWADALGVVERELRRALEHGFSQAELDEQVAGMRASYEAAAEGADTRRTEGLANAVVGRAGEDEVFTHPRRDLERFETLAGEVTLEEVEAEFRATWGEDEPVIYIGTNAPIEGGEEAVLTAYLESRAEPVELLETGAGEGFAYEDFGAPGVVAEQSRIEDFDVALVTFENGVRLNLKSTDFEDDRVRVRVRIGAGQLETPRDAPGVEWLADNAFIAGGLEAHSFDDLQTLFAGENVGLDFSVGGDAFTFAATTTPSDLALQLELFAAYLVAPGYREEAIARYRRSIEVWYESLDATPGGVASRDVPRLIADGDPRYGVPSQEELATRTFDELRAALADPFARGEIEISLVGDLDEETAIAAVAATFGALPARAEREIDPEARIVNFPDPVEAPVRLVHAGEPTRALLYTYWPTTDDRDTKLYAEISLLEAVMDLKLIDRVREADGATYSPGAGSFMSGISPDYGYLYASLDLAPEDIASYFDVIDEIAASIAAGEVSEDELQRARQPILESLEEIEEDNGSWLSLISTAQTEPRYLEARRVYSGLIEAVTVDDVVAAAGTYLDPAKAYRIEIVPGPDSGESEAAPADDAEPATAEEAGD